MITVQIPTWIAWFIFAIVFLNSIQFWFLIYIHNRNTNLQERILKQIKYMNFLRDKK